MVWSTSLIKKMRFGRTRVHFGKYTTTLATTGGDIDTEMDSCAFLIPWQNKATAVATEVAVDEDFSAGPIDGSAITIMHEAAGDGYWIAVGR